jgi:CRP-like cAMP-binding protein
MEKLEHHQLFSSLSRNELKVVCQEMIYAKSQEAKYVFKQGEIGSCFFLIYKGKVDVEIDDKHIRTLEKGHSFGELALLFRTSRSASIACQTKTCEFLVMKPALYRKTLQKMKLEE